MMRKGHYYVRFLTEDELERFKVNSVYHGPEYLEREFDDFRDFIRGGFIWSDTNEGHWYWLDIAYRKISDNFMFKGFSRYSMI